MPTARAQLNNVSTQLIISTIGSYTENIVDDCKDDIVTVGSYKSLHNSMLTDVITSPRI